VPVRRPAGGCGVASGGAERWADRVLAEEALARRDDGGGDDEAGADGAPVCAGSEASEAPGDVSRGVGAGVGSALAGGAASRGRRRSRRLPARGWRWPRGAGGDCDCGSPRRSRNVDGTPGRSCCSGRSGSRSWSARSARKSVGCWRRSTIRRPSRGCSVRWVCLWRFRSRRVVERRLWGKGSTTSASAARSDDGVASAVISGRPRWGTGGSAGREGGRRGPGVGPKTGWRDPRDEGVAGAAE
jgi:hypothetical protein